MTPNKNASAQVETRDYSTLTDGNLNRRVAERQGWREAVLDDTLLLKYPYATPMHRGHRCLVAPDGSVYGATLKETADSLWAYLFENEASWATSIDAAAGLDFGEWRLIIRVHGNRLEITVLSSYTRFEVIKIEYPREKLARAISECWLMYGDATEAKS